MEESLGHHWMHLFALVVEDFIEYMMHHNGETGVFDYPLPIFVDRHIFLTIYKMG